MGNKMHLLELYDAEDFDGPNPIHVTGVGVVNGPENAKYYVIQLLEPIQLEQIMITQLAIRPHYDGDAVDRAIESVCTVGITFGKPDQYYVPGDKYGFDDFRLWKVGKIHPVEKE